MNRDRSVIEIENLSYRYDREPVLDGVSLIVKDGEFLGIVGPNGGGKTTLLKIILGFLSPESGTIRVFDGTPRQSASKLGYVPQHAVFDRDFPISVLDVVLLGLLGNVSSLGRFHASEREIAEHVLQKVDMLELRHRRFGDL